MVLIKDTTFHEYFLMLFWVINMQRRIHEFNASFVVTIYLSVQATLEPVILVVLGRRIMHGLFVLFITKLKRYIDLPMLPILHLLEYFGFSIS